MNLDALPDEIGEVILGRAVRKAVESERAKGCACIRAVCQTWRSASDAALKERYEAQVRALISNMRIHCDDHLPRRYVLMYAFGPCRSPFRPQMRYECGTCGSPVAEIAKCDSCQSDRLLLASSAPPPPFPWKRALLGPAASIVAASVVVSLLLRAGGAVTRRGAPPLLLLRPPLPFRR